MCIGDKRAYPMHIMYVPANIVSKFFITFFKTFEYNSIPILKVKIVDNLFSFLPFPTTMCVHAVSQKFHANHPRELLCAVDRGYIESQYSGLLIALTPWSIVVGNIQWAIFTVA